MSEELIPSGMIRRSTAPLNGSSPNSDIRRKGRRIPSVRKVSSALCGRARFWASFSLHFATVLSGHQSFRLISGGRYTPRLKIPTFSALFIASPFLATTLFVVKVAYLGDSAVDRK